MLSWTDSRTKHSLIASTTLDILDYLNNGTLVSFLVQHGEAVVQILNFSPDTILCLCVFSLPDRTYSPGRLSLVPFKKKFCLKYKLFKWEERGTAALAAELSGLVCEVLTARSHIQGTSLSSEQG